MVPLTIKGWSRATSLLRLRKRYSKPPLSRIKCGSSRIVVANDRNTASHQQYLSQKPSLQYVHLNIPSFAKYTCLVVVFLNRRERAASLNHNRGGGTPKRCSRMPVTHSSSGSQSEKLCTQLTDWLQTFALCCVPDPFY